MRNVKPPEAPILLGKPQILPRPTAEPTAAIRNPKLVPKPFLSSIFSLLTFFPRRYAADVSVSYKENKPL